MNAIHSEVYDIIGTMEQQRFGRGTSSAHTALLLFALFAFFLFSGANPNKKKAATVQATSEEARKKDKNGRKKKNEKSNNIRSESKALMRARFIVR